jgi:hypothetical protein
MFLNSSGNLGLGATPSTWTGTGVKAFQFQNGPLAASLTYGTILSWNAYYDGGYKYFANSSAGVFNIAGNEFTWLTAASGTAGNAISFTQAMTLASTGNLLIGTTTDGGYKLSVAGQGFISTTGAGFLNSQLILDNPSNSPSLIQFGNNLNGYGFGLNTTTTQRFVFYNGGPTEIANINGATGIYTPLSDINKKKNFEESFLGLNEVLKLKPTLYNMKTQKDDEPKELGLIAQEVKDVIKQAYIEYDDFIGLNYNAIVVTLVKAIQELNTKIENLKN